MVVREVSDEVELQTEWSEVMPSGCGEGGAGPVPRLLVPFRGLYCTFSTSRWSCLYVSGSSRRCRRHLL